MKASLHKEYSHLLIQVSVYFTRISRLPRRVAEGERHSSQSNFHTANAANAALNSSNTAIGVDGSTLTPMHDATEMTPCGYVNEPLRRAIATCGRGRRKTGFQPSGYAVVVLSRQTENR